VLAMHEEGHAGGEIGDLPVLAHPGHDGVDLLGASRRNGQVELRGHSEPPNRECINYYASQRGSQVKSYGCDLMSGVLTSLTAPAGSATNSSLSNGLDSRTSSIPRRCLGSSTRPCTSSIF